MLEIRRDQIDAFGEQAREAFESRSLAFLKANYPEWSAMKSPEEMDAFLSETVAFGSRHHVSTEANLWKLLHCRIALGLTVEPPEHVLFRLRELDVPEDNRVEGVCNVLAGNLQGLKVLDAG